MKDKLWDFTDNIGSFISEGAGSIRSLYFPLGNEKIMSSISPDLYGDIKTGQDSFLLTPVSRIDLTDSRSSRNFWVRANDKIWSATGVSKDIKQTQSDKFKLQAGLLWHKVTRENKGVGLRAEILSFVPATEDPVEIMQVKLTNISSKSIKFTPVAAIPVYARGAGNIRDHRHVTSLLQRITLDRFGVIVKPTLIFDESGHRTNKTNYFVVGFDEKFKAPRYIYPTQEMFCGDSGDLEAPESVLRNLLPGKENIQGKEAMGALRFNDVNLSPDASRTYIILLGITDSSRQIKKMIGRFNSLKKVNASLEANKRFWAVRLKQSGLNSGDVNFDNWFRWVSIQPVLRKIFGCSYLPDFDYGKGGRGWRDLWQDCLGLILANPGGVRELLINNFSGVRIDGSNATIIGKKPGEFIADRNDITRVWMDHGVWPLLTLDLYLNETGDFDILFKETAYFRDRHISRSRALGPTAKDSKLRNLKGAIYTGSVLEHLLVQNLVQFFNVGPHNHVRLEGADWNDGLDMAQENGESVAFSCMYAYNLRRLAEIIKYSGRQKIRICAELKPLFSKINYNNISAKQKILNNYFDKTESVASGIKIDMDSRILVANLEAKAEWMAGYIRRHEWLKEGFFNGYYDNNKKAVEGRMNGSVRMTLTGQVFPIASGIATDTQVKNIFKNAQKYLFDKRLKGYHLNTDFESEEHNLGRAFSFVYGDKENGAYFNHMVVMFANALYKRGYAKEGWQVLSSIYNMAFNTAQSKIYPCLPEYFNLEGRGMYSYLTGSASWFVLTMLTEVFGLKGRYGDLVVQPKLSAGQFKNKIIRINRVFSGRHLEVNLSYFGKSEPRKIIKANLNSSNIVLESPSRLIIRRNTILRLPKDKVNHLNIILG